MARMSFLNKDALTKCLILSLSLAGLTACNMLQSIEDTLPQRDPQYKSSKSLPPLEIPPDLSSSTVNDQLVVPSDSRLGATTYSEYAGSTQVASANQMSSVLPERQNVRVERSGDERWLVVDATAAEVWPKIRAFWLDQGFLIKKEDPSIGIMETDWAENRADLPQNLIGKLLSSISTKLYAATIRDKYRTRLEKAENRVGATEVYVSHQGIEEVARKEDSIWQPRPPDPELEVEMLNRLVVYLGATQEQADQMLAESQPQVDRAHMVRRDDGETLLALDEDFSRAWRRTGLALDRVGFTVEDRDRSRGLYYVRYVDPLKDVPEDEKGWLDKLQFWDSNEEPPPTDDNGYLISLIGEGAQTEVVILNNDGERDNSSTAGRILGLLYEQLR